MPDHLHLAVWSEAASSVQAFLKDFLRRTSAMIAGLVARAAKRGDSQTQEWLERFRDRARQKARVRVWKEGKPGPGGESTFDGITRGVLPRFVGALDDS